MEIGPEIVGKHSYSKAISSSHLTKTLIEDPRPYRRP